jgi:hypothetical protein
MGVRTIHDIPELTLHIKQPIGIVKCEIEQNRLRPSHGQRVLYSCRFIRLSYIPDCILQASVSSHQHAALRLAIHSIDTVPKYMLFAVGPDAPDLECSRNILQDALRSSIDANCEADNRTRNFVEAIQHYVNFRDLVTLNRMVFLGQERPGVIDAELLRATTRSWDPSCFQELLKEVEYSRRDGVELVTAEQLAGIRAALPQTEEYKLIADAIEATVEDWQRRQRHREENEACQQERGSILEERERLWAEVFPSHADETGQVVTGRGGAVYTPSTQP